MNEEELKYLEQIKSFTQEDSEIEVEYDNADKPFDHEVD